MLLRGDTVDGGTADRIGLDTVAGGWGGWSVGGRAEIGVWSTWRQLGLMVVLKIEGIIYRDWRKNPGNV